jgi:uncharacterized phage-like protein YoqJ
VTAGPVIAGTGHRPVSLGGYGPDARIRLAEFAIEQLQELKPRKVISGMAIGWDTALAQAALSLRIPYIAAIPFFGQEKLWSHADQQMYLKLVQDASEVVIVCQGGFESHKMQIRNRWMVDRCDLVLALWNGRAGGTGNCVRYVEERRRAMKNVWKEWQQCLSKAI